MTRRPLTVHAPSVSTRLTGKRGILILALLLIVASYAMRWYGAGGPAVVLALDDQRVKASLAVVAASTFHQKVAVEGVLDSAWLSPDDRGYIVNLTVMLDKNPWHVAAVFSPEGTPIESSVHLSGGVLIPIYIERLGYCLAALWFVVVFLWPRVFGNKCPDCPGSFWKPAVLDTVETTVYPGGWDDEGYHLDPIARRDLVCERCGYRRVAYFIPLDRNPGKVFRTPAAAGNLTVKQEEALQEVLDEWWEANPRSTKFRNQEEWRAYYDELKASEHEEKPGIR